MRALTITCLVVGCGRLSFDPLSTPDRCAFGRIAAGNRFTCGIDLAGRVWCWGDNASGQVEPGGPGVVPAATKVVLPGPAIELGAGKAFACARLDDTTIWCWGNNASGQLGIGTTAPVMAPVQAALGADAASELGVGAEHACIRRVADGAIVCWGNNRNLALGNASGTVEPTPTAIVGTADVRRLAIGHRHGCLIDGQDMLSCWGKGTYGQIGGALTSREVPMRVSGLGAVTDVATGGGTTCAIDPAGDVRCWGRNNGGQVGDGTLTQTSTPSAPVVGNAAEVSLGSSAGCARRIDGSLACWGAGSLDGVDKIRLVAEDSALRGVTQVAMGYQHACALTGTQARCWGIDDRGELGRGARGAAATPQRVPLPQAADAIAVANSHACARVAGTIYCWGGNRGGQLGAPDAGFSGVPLAVSIGLTTIEGITASGHTCAWGSGSAWCWGDNRAGQLGDGATSCATCNGVAPVQVAVANISAMATGGQHTCAITGTTVQCWGSNTFGQLGDNTTVSSIAPVTVVGLSSATAISAGIYSSCAVAAGAVACWGRNDSGQLGDGTTMSRSTPFTVAVPGTVADVVVERNHTCAWTTVGDVYCWGDNATGQLGQGDTIDRRTPTHVPLPAPTVEVGLGGDTSATASYGGTCARLATGAVYCWGRGSDGERADGTFTDTLVPTEAPALAGADALARAAHGGCTIRSGDVLCWGTYPMLGVDNTSWAEAQPVALTCTE